MRISPFEESTEYRKIVPYDPAYATVFSIVKRDVESRFEDFELFHIGSSAVPDLRGKPMVDIVATTEHRDLREAQTELEKIGFHRRDVWVDVDEKPYLCGSMLENGKRYNINIHICREDDEVHRNTLVFVDALKRSPELRREYERAKDLARAAAPEDPELYNKSKESFIKQVYEQKR